MMLQPYLEHLPKGELSGGNDADRDAKPRASPDGLTEELPNSYTPGEATLVPTLTTVWEHVSW